MFFKVCGIRRQEDANKAMELGFSAVGFIMEEHELVGELRQVTPVAASGIETGDMVRVGVFLSNNPLFILHAARTARLDLVQLHGDQKTDFVDYLGRYLEKDRLVRVIWPDQFDTVEELSREAKRWRTRCGAVLFDGGMAGGGHGEKLDLAITDSLDLALPWILAGGLDVESVEEVAKLPVDKRPVGMDFNSRLEKIMDVKEIVVNQDSTLGDLVSDLDGNQDGNQNGNQDGNQDGKRVRTLVRTHHGVKDHQKMTELMDRVRQLGFSIDGLPPFVHSRTLLRESF